MTWRPHSFIHSHSHTHTHTVKVWNWVHALADDPLECFSYTLSLRPVHMGNVGLCVCVCLSLTTPSLLTLPDERRGAFQLLVTAVRVKRDSEKEGKKREEERDRGANQRERGVKDTKIVEPTEIWVAKKSESSVCGMQECVCVYVCVRASCVSEGCKLGGFFTRQDGCGFPQ